MLRYHWAVFHQFFALKFHPSVPQWSGGGNPLTSRGNLSTSLYPSLHTLSVFQPPVHSHTRSGCDSGVHQVEMPAERFVTMAVICALMAQNCRGELVAHVQELNPVPESSLLKPKVMIAILARNSAHSLPYYLGCIDRLDYPKDRIAIWWDSPNWTFMECGCRGVWFALQQVCWLKTEKVWYIVELLWSARR